MQGTIIAKSTSASIYDEKISLLLQHQQRLSLAYGALDDVPYLILIYIADKIQILDLSHNQFRNLSFLQYFPGLQTLVLDKNSSLDCRTLPAMANLEILWLNNCNLINITDWLHTIQVQCPSLRQLSMMCNPVGLTALNGVSEADEKEYRKQVLKILPSLEYFDGVRITDNHRRLAAKSNFSIALLEDIFRKKIQNFVEFSTKLHKNYMSMERLNAAFVKHKSLSTKSANT